MTRDDIIRMAREAGFSEWAVQTPQDLERFAALVAAAEREACKELWEAQRLTDQQISDHIEAAVAAEREACAKIAEEHQHDCYDGDLDWHEARRITAAIRARGEE